MFPLVTSLTCVASCVLIPGSRLLLRNWRQCQLGTLSWSVAKSLSFAWRYPGGQRGEQLFPLVFWKVHKHGQRAESHWKDGAQKIIIINAFLDSAALYIKPSESSLSPFLQGIQMLWRSKGLCGREIGGRPTSKGRPRGQKPLQGVQRRLCEFLKIKFKKSLAYLKL